MRIVLSNASSKWGGLHLVTELLADGLVRHGHDVLVLCRPGSILESRLTGRFDLEPLPRGMDFSPLAIARMIRVLRRFRPDVVLAMMGKDLRITGAAAALLRIPVVARHANDQPVRGGWYGRLIYDRIASSHIVNSEATRRTLHESAPYLDATRTTVIYNGVDVDGIDAAGPADLPVPADAVVIGFIARLDERKGVRDLLDSWPDVARRNPHAHLVIAGRGALTTEVERRSRQLDRVVFLGYRDDVASILKRCDVVAMPSHWEGFGMVAAEAIAAGKPVVASNASSLPEIIRNGCEGLLVPPREPAALADALVRLADDPDLRIRLGANGHRRVRDCFTREAMIEQYIATLTARTRTTRGNHA